MRNNSIVTDLPEGVFGDVSFELFILERVEMITVHPSIILQSKERLQNLTIGGGLEEFPWEVLPQLTRLYYLNLGGNSLTALPPLQSPTLEYLILGNNFIDALEAGWSTPNLLQMLLCECYYVLFFFNGPFD